MKNHPKRLRKLNKCPATSLDATTASTIRNIQLDERDIKIYDDFYQFLKEEGVVHVFKKEIAKRRKRVVYPVKSLVREFKARNMNYYNLVCSSFFWNDSADWIDINTKWRKRYKKLFV